MAPQVVGGVAAADALVGLALHVEVLHVGPLVVVLVLEPAAGALHWCQIATAALIPVPHTWPSRRQGCLQTLSIAVTSSAAVD